MRSSSLLRAYAGASPNCSPPPHGHVSPPRRDMACDRHVTMCHASARIGWSSLAAKLELGKDAFGFGFGGTGKKSHANKFDTYGEPYGAGDVVGCALDRARGLISYSRSQSNALRSTSGACKASTQPRGRELVAARVEGTLAPVRQLCRDFVIVWGRHLDFDAGSLPKVAVDPAANAENDCWHCKDCA